MKLHTLLLIAVTKISLLLFSIECWSQSAGLKIHDLPFSPAEVKNNFNLIGTSSISIPYNGGIYEVIFKTWLIPPSTKLGIIGYDRCLSDTSLVLAVKKDSSLMLVKGKHSKKNYINRNYCQLPIGICQITSVGLDSFFVWHYNQDYSTIYFYNDYHQLKPLLQTKDTITAFYVVNPTTLLFAIGPKLYSLGADSQPMLFLNFPASIDGLAQDDQGYLIVSTGKGIFLIDGKKKAELLIKETHGFIRCEKNTLFVLDRGKNKIVQVKL
jgi:hypothetical protein